MLVYESNNFQIYDRGDFVHVIRRKTGNGRIIGNGEAKIFWRHYDRCVHSPSAMAYLLESYL